MNPGLIDKECMLASNSIAKLRPFAKSSKLVNVVIDTPRGLTCKLKYDEELGIYYVHKALPLGLAFPFNFGFIPSTEGGDGDPLDVLLLTGYVFPAGSVVLTKVIAILEAEQIENKKKQRNDRLIGIPIEVVSQKPMQPVVEFSSDLKSAISDFFIHYNQLQGRIFRPLRYASASAAIRAVRKSTRAPL